MYVKWATSERNFVFFVVFIVKRVTLHNCVTIHSTNNIKFANDQHIEHIIPPARLLI